MKENNFNWNTASAEAIALKWNTLQVFLSTASKMTIGLARCEQFLAKHGRLDPNVLRIGENLVAIRDEVLYRGDHLNFEAFVLTQIFEEIERQIRRGLQKD